MINAFSLATNSFAAASTAATSTPQKLARASLFTSLTHSCSSAGFSLLRASAALVKPLRSVTSVPGL